MADIPDSQKHLPLSEEDEDEENFVPSTCLDKVNYKVTIFFHLIYQFVSYFLQ